MKKEPLRTRLAGLLPPSLSLPINYKQQRLLDTLSRIDRTIDFLYKFRNKKVMLFKDLQQSIYESMKFKICLEDVQKILYVAPKLYALTWIKTDNANCNTYIGEDY